MKHEDFKEGDLIINSYDKGNQFWPQKGYTYTFLRYYDENKRYLQTKEILKASPDHNLYSHEFSRFAWWKYILFNIQRRIFEYKRIGTGYKMETVCDYCRWKPFGRSTNDAPTKYYKGLDELDRQQKTQKHGSF